MSDPTLPGTPGTGPLPEPEAEGFRDEQIEAERTRQIEERKTQAELNVEATEKYSGKDRPEPEPPPVEGGATSLEGDDYGSGDTPTKAKGASKSTGRTTKS